MQLNTFKIAGHTKAQVQRNNMGNFHLFNYLIRQICLELTTEQTLYVWK